MCHLTPMVPLIVCNYFLLFFFALGNTYLNAKKKLNPNTPLISFLDYPSVWLLVFHEVLFQFSVYFVSFSAYGRIWFFVTAKLVLCLYRCRKFSHMKCHVRNLEWHNQVKIELGTDNVDQERSVAGERRAPVINLILLSTSIPHLQLWTLLNPVSARIIVLISFQWRHNREDP